MALNKYVQFTGDFKLLKPNGWRFGKAFGHNYRYYRWSKKEYGEHITIWQHLGGYLEIRDLFDASHIIVDSIQNGTLEKIVSGRTSKQYWIVLNQDTGTLHDKYDCPEHSLDLKTKVECKVYNEKKAQEYYDKWRTYNLQQSTVDKIKELLDKGWIKVTVDTRK